MMSGGDSRINIEKKGNKFIIKSTVTGNAWTVGPDDIVTAALDVRTAKERGWKDKDYWKWLTDALEPTFIDNIGSGRQYWIIRNERWYFFSKQYNVQLIRV